MAGIKSLFKDTVIYGVSSIAGRMINWLLVPFYTHILTQASDYGIVTNIYAWVAILLILLTYGTETGYFRFANKEDLKEKKVFSTILIGLLITTSLFLIATYSSSGFIANSLKYPDHPEYIMLMACIIAMDVIVSLPFARLRYQQRPILFASLKLVSIAINIACNLFFLLLCPWWASQSPDGWVHYIYEADKQVLYIFISNFISSFVILLFFLPSILRIRWFFDRKLFKQVLHYSFPLLLVGLAGSLSLFVDKILYPHIAPASSDALHDLGIYGANYKIAVIMVMLTQAFRFAFEPFIFARSKSKQADETQIYAHIMNYFIAFGLLVFLGVTCFIDIVKHFIDASYHSGLNIVPLVLLANLFLGILYNLSLWYKLSDRTYYGAGIAILGALITLVINLIFVPMYGYTACAWAALICYLSMCVTSYFLGRKYYPIHYNLKRISLYFIVAISFFLINQTLIIHLDSTFLQYTLRSTLILTFMGLVAGQEKLRAYLKK